MSDDFRVDFPHSHTVHSSNSKRDHVTDSAVNSVPGRGREHRKRRDKDGRSREDRVEFSVDLSQAEGNATGRVSGELEDGAAHRPDQHAPAVMRGTKKPRDESTSGDEDTGGEPGDLLDVEA